MTSLRADEQAAIARLRADAEHWHSHYDAALANWKEVLSQKERAEALAIRRKDALKQAHGLLNNRSIRWLGSAPKLKHTEVYLAWMKQRRTALKTIAAALAEESTPELKQAILETL